MMQKKVTVCCFLLFYNYNFFGTFFQNPMAVLHVYRAEKAIKIPYLKKNKTIKNLTPIAYALYIYALFVILCIAFIFLFYILL